jgi:hypothetical protein
VGYVASHQSIKRQATVLAAVNKGVRDADVSGAVHDAGHLAEADKEPHVRPVRDALDREDSREGSQAHRWDELLQQPHRVVAPRLHGPADRLRKLGTEPPHGYILL